MMQFDRPKVRTVVIQIKEQEGSKYLRSLTPIRLYDTTPEEVHQIVMEALHAQLRKENPDAL